MALDGFTPDAIIERLSWRPAYILNSMITISKRIRSRALPRTLASSSIGSLDTLPAELLHIILNSLDFQSLLRFARACHQAKTRVESLLSYQHMMKHAPTVLIALSQTKLITFHAAGTIHAAFLSDKCVSCQIYAAFLFLPTCKRCCYECLSSERSLRVITIRMAEVCFGVSRKDLAQIPTMFSIPGRYAVGHVVPHQKRVKLVSLKQAQKLGISVHGSQEAMESVGVSRDAPKIKNVRHRQRRLAQWIAGSNSADRQNDEFCGVASISFPSLRPKGEVENGLWCGGCRINSENYSSTIGMDIDARMKALLEKEHQARSRSEFLEHIRDCAGASDLLLEPGRLSPWEKSTIRRTV